MTEITKPVTTGNVEDYLDSGVLYVAMRKGNWWLARRNGKTKVLKRRPEYKSIPFKVGFKECGRITTDDSCWIDMPAYFRHEDDIPSKK